MILYHGSPEIVQTPEYDKGKPYNDYGMGFYCTENEDLAKEWACSENSDGYVNQYVINPLELWILNLASREYTILHWLALLMKFRQIRVSTPVMRRSVEWLIENYLPDIDRFDAIVGYRADDSYFSFARAFANNEISLRQLSYAMRLGGLGEQFVLKSKKAFSLIRFVSSMEVPYTVYLPKRKQRDDNARAAFREELEREDLDGLFIRDIVREGIKPDDPRLQ
jgi:hypothetical protein